MMIADILRSKYAQGWTVNAMDLLGEDICTLGRPYSVSVADLHLLKVAAEHSRVAKRLTGSA